MLRGQDKATLHDCHTQERIIAESVSFTMTKGVYTARAVIIRETGMELLYLSVTVRF